MKINFALRLTALLLCIAALSGCVPNVIREDAVSDGLPLIDPDEGVGRSETVTLYFKLKGEPFLVPVTDTLTVRASEYDAEVVMERLIEGPGMLLGDLEPALPEGARALKVSVEKDMAYVTLSEELFGGEGWTVDDRHMSICAIVNSLTALSGISRVQVWDSMGKRLTSFQYGFDVGGQQLLGPLGRQDDVVLTPKKLVERTFFRLIEGNYIQAYELFAESEPGGGEKPSYAAFETRLKSLGSIEAVTVNSVTELAGGISAEAVVDITLATRPGEVKILKNVVLQLVTGERYKVGLHSLMKALQGA